VVWFLPNSHLESFLPTNFEEIHILLWHQQNMVWFFSNANIQLTLIYLCVWIN
jgi:hypothetical protein